MLVLRAAVLGVVLGAAMLVGCAAEPTPQPDEDRHADWWLASEPTNAALELEVFAGSRQCDAYRGVDVTEFEDEVRVTAQVDVIGGPECPGDRTVERVTVPLAGDLGDRQLTGCVAPTAGLRSPDLDDHDERDDAFDCRDRQPPQ